MRTDRFRLEPLGPQHNADEFEKRVAFAYTVLRSDTDDVIGCLYLDPVLRQAVRDWLTGWPFEQIVYAG